MIALRLSLLCLLALTVPAAAQTSPPPGVLKLPPKNAPPEAPDTPPVTQAAPVAPVQQVAPFATPQPHPPLKVPPQSSAAAPVKAAKAKPAPVIPAQPNVHAQRPLGSAPAATKPAPTAAGAAAPAVGPAAAPAPVATAPVPAGPDKGSVTGYPIPRWASLRSDEVNLRVGPGTRFRIEWQYHRRDLPVQIVDERDVWRQIRDQDGVTGWVHSATLVGRRGFAVKVSQATVRSAPSETADPVAYLKLGVVGHLRFCEAASEWCEVQVGDRRGYLKRDQFYGSMPGEAVTN